MIVAWAADDGVFVATFPDVSGLKAYGPTAGAAAQAGEEVIILRVASMIDAGRSLPNPSAFPLSA
jgi:predicted RNase H-like HicB family nuclease